MSLPHQRLKIDATDVKKTFFKSLFSGIDIKSLKELHSENLSTEIEKKESEFNEKLKILETEKKTQTEKIDKIRKQLDEGNLKKKSKQMVKKFL